MIRAFFILLLLCSLCYGGTRDPSTPDQKYVEYGQKFTYVGQLCGTNADNKMYCASAVAIKRRWIITAAHVVKDSKSCFLKIKEKKIEISKIFIPDEFEKNFGYYDIALGKSSEDIELDFFPELYSKDDEVGKICCISGFGIHGTFNSGANLSDGKQRAGSNIIEYIDRHLLICSPSKPNDKKRTSLEFLIASGDSGGGLFIDNKLAGINSCVLATDKNPNSTYGDESGHTRISVNLPWILETIEKNEK